MLDDLAPLLYGVVGAMIGALVGRFLVRILQSSARGKSQDPLSSVPQDAASERAAVDQEIARLEQRLESLKEQKRELDRE
jgi:hypothetical protein